MIGGKNLGILVPLNVQVDSGAKDGCSQELEKRKGEINYMPYNIDTEKPESGNKFWQQVAG